MNTLEALQAALEHVYGGDQSIEAGAVADQLEDRGVRLIKLATGGVVRPDKILLIGEGHCCGLVSPREARALLDGES